MQFGTFDRVADAFSEWRQGGGQQGPVPRMQIYSCDEVAGAPSHRGRSDNSREDARSVILAAARRSPWSHKCSTTGPTYGLFWDDAYGRGPVHLSK